MSADIDSIHKNLMANIEAISQIDFAEVRTYHNTLERLDAEIKRLHAEQEALIEDFCAKCTHPKEFLAVASFKSTTFFDFMPIRICKICGGTEEGWNYHFINPRDKNGKFAWTSDHDLPKIDRDDLFKIRRKIFKSE